MYNRYAQYQTNTTQPPTLPAQPPSPPPPPPPPRPMKHPAAQSTHLDQRIPPTYLYPYSSPYLQPLPPDPSIAAASGAASAPAPDSDLTTISQANRQWPYQSTRIPSPISSIPPSYEQTQQQHRQLGSVFPPLPLAPLPPPPPPPRPSQHVTLGNGQGQYTPSMEYHPHIYGHDAVRHNGGTVEYNDAYMLGLGTMQSLQALPPPPPPPPQPQPPPPPPPQPPTSEFYARPQPPALPPRATAVVYGAQTSTSASHTSSQSQQPSNGNTNPQNIPEQQQHQRPMSLAYGAHFDALAAATSWQQRQQPQQTIQPTSQYQPPVHPFGSHGPYTADTVSDANTNQQIRSSLPPNFQPPFTGSEEDAAPPPPPQAQSHPYAQLPHIGYHQLTMGGAGLSTQQHSSVETYMYYGQTQAGATPTSSLPYTAHQSIQPIQAVGKTHASNLPAKVPTNSAFGGPCNPKTPDLQAQQNSRRHNITPPRTKQASGIWAAHGEGPGLNPSVFPTYSSPLSHPKLHAQQASSSTNGTIRTAVNESPPRRLYRPYSVHGQSLLQQRSSSVQSFNAHPPAAGTSNAPKPDHRPVLPGYFSSLTSQPVSPAQSYSSDYRRPLANYSLSGSSLGGSIHRRPSSPVLSVSPKPIESETDLAAEPTKPNASALGPGGPSDWEYMGLLGGGGGDEIASPTQEVALPVRVDTGVQHIAEMPSNRSPTDIPRLRRESTGVSALTDDTLQAPAPLQVRKQKLILPNVSDQLTSTADTAASSRFLDSSEPTDPTLNSQNDGSTPQPIMNANPIPESKDRAEQKQAFVQLAETVSNVDKVLSVGLSDTTFGGSSDNSHVNDVARDERTDPIEKLLIQDNEDAKPVIENGRVTPSAKGDLQSTAVGGTCLTNEDGIERCSEALSEVDLWYKTALERYEMMLRREASSSGTQAKRRIFINFIKLEAAPRGIDIIFPSSPADDEDSGCGTTLSAASSRTDQTAERQKTPIVAIGPPSTSQQAERPSKKPLTITIPDDEDDGVEYSPGGRPILHQPVRPERPAPQGTRLTTGNLSSKDKPLTAYRTMSPAVESTRDDIFTSEKPLARRILPEKEASLTSDHSFIPAALTPTSSSDGETAKTLGPSHFDNNNSLKPVLASQEIQELASDTSGIILRPHAEPRPDPHIDVPDHYKAEDVSVEANDGGDAVHMESLVAAVADSLPEQDLSDVHDFDRISAQAKRFRSDSGWINQLTTAWEADAESTNNRLADARKGRKEAFDLENEALYNANEIGYGDMRGLELTFEAKERELQAQEERDEYSRYATAVFTPVYDRLQKEIYTLSRLGNETIRQVCSCSSELKTALEHTPLNHPALPEPDAQDATNSGKPCQASDAFLYMGISLYCYLIMQCEARHAQLTRAVSERDARYQSTEINPARAAGDVERLVTLEGHFASAAANAAVASTSAHAERLDGHVDAFRGIINVLRDRFVRAKTCLSNALDALETASKTGAYAPSTEDEDGVSISDVIACASDALEQLDSRMEELLRLQHSLELLSLQSHYDATVAKAKCVGDAQLELPKYELMHTDALRAAEESFGSMKTTLQTDVERTKQDLRASG